MHLRELQTALPPPERGCAPQPALRRPDHGKDNSTQRPSRATTVPAPQKPGGQGAEGWGAPCGALPCAPVFSVPTTCHCREAGRRGPGEAKCRGSCLPSEFTLPSWFGKNVSAHGWDRRDRGHPNKEGAVAAGRLGGGGASLLLSCLAKLGWCAVLSDLTHDTNPYTNHTLRCCKGSVSISCKPAAWWSACPARAHTR